MNPSEAWCFKAGLVDLKSWWSAKYRVCIFLFYLNSSCLYLQLVFLRFSENVSNCLVFFLLSIYFFKCSCFLYWTSSLLLVGPIISYINGMSVLLNRLLWKNSCSLHSFAWTLLLALPVISRVLPSACCSAQTTCRRMCTSMSYISMGWPKGQEATWESSKRSQQHLSVDMTSVCY